MWGGRVLDVEPKILGLKFGFLTGWPRAAAPLGIKAHPTYPLFDPVSNLQQWFR